MKAVNDDRGVTLVETVMAIFIALVAIAGLGGAIFTALVQNKNQGAEITVATTLARDKMEQLLGLSFADTTTNVTGISGTGWSTGLSAGGTLTQMTGCPPSDPTAVGRMDFLNSTGNQITGSCAAVTNFSYVRQWAITNDVASQTTPTRVFGLKRITVVVYSAQAAGAGGQTPFVEVTSYKSE